MFICCLDGGSLDLFKKLVVKDLQDGISTVTRCTLLHLRKKRIFPINDFQVQLQTSNIVSEWSFQPRSRDPAFIEDMLYVDVERPLLIDVPIEDNQPPVFKTWCNCMQSLGRLNEILVIIRHCYNKKIKCFICIFCHRNCNNIPDLWWTILKTRCKNFIFFLMDTSQTDVIFFSCLWIPTADFLSAWRRN